MFVLLQKCGGGSHVLLSWLEEFALLVSAVCHDIGHPGVNNDFLVSTSHELAIRYNDTSPLENMHCARLFAMVTNPSMAVFGRLSRERYHEVRCICIEAILHTDNVHHLSLVKSLQMFGEMNSELLEHARELLDLGEDHAIWPPRELVDVMWEPDARRMLRNNVLHFADISNPVKPFDVCREWANCVLEEFFSQGDLMRERGLPVPPLHDRARTNKPFSQISFIEFFVAPLVFATVRVLAPLQGLEEELLFNARRWMELWRVEASPPEEELQGVAQRLRRLEERASTAMPSRTPSRPATARAATGQASAGPSSGPSARSSSTGSNRSKESLGRPAGHPSGPFFRQGPGRISRNSIQSL